MNEKVKAYAANEPQGKFEPFEFEAGELGNKAVEIKVAYIETLTENFKRSQINEAFEHLENGKARYRIVLENNF